jgi:polysaccharide export outer membrane protein
LSAGDVLDIAVQGHDELKEEATILPDGTFTYPIVGSVTAAGLTVAQLTSRLTQGLSAQINEPQVTVTVRQAFPEQVSVLGAVKIPGQYAFKPGMHVLDAIAAAGGPNQDLVQTDINLVSVSHSSTRIISGAQLTDPSIASVDPLLQPGDVLLVQQANPATSQVDVTGEVQHPGFYSAPKEGVSLQTLIDDAGGLTANAATAHVQYRHGDSTHVLNLNQVGFGSAPDTSTIVFPGDSIAVPTNHAKIAVLGEVHSPGPFVIPDGQGLSVTSAITLAGGMTPDSDQVRADVLRQGSNGKPVVIPVNIASILKGDPSAPDLALQPGDILYVPTHGDKGPSGTSVLSVLPVLGWFLR